jgi:hypothetical protein
MILKSCPNEISTEHSQMFADNKNINNFIEIFIVSELKAKDVKRNEGMCSCFLAVYRTVKTNGVPCVHQQ